MNPYQRIDEVDHRRNKGGPDLKGHLDKYRVHKTYDYETENDENCGNHSEGNSTEIKLRKVLENF